MYLEMPQAGQGATSTGKPIKNVIKTGLKHVINARSIVNKKIELNIMVEDTDPHKINYWISLPKSKHKRRG